MSINMYFPRDCDANLLLSEAECGLYDLLSIFNSLELLIFIYLLN